ncbi:MAG: hypothetical protein OEV49_12160 [candidate division Zixibacteria bacterium]|nr:hypothetical protein [candidate division Zixibacteria bacterium]MDH3937313.1 hypothetical protein [candidate division Zixibacteria bacterium]MDH4033093.1 hypothetical protein [candidate division Zixibacteria bacterium]
MKTDYTKFGRRAARRLVLTAIVGLLSLPVLTTNCRDKPTVEDTNDHLELIRYIESNEDGRYLFRTDSVIFDYPYTKPGRPGVVFRDSLDSVGRRYFTDIPNYWEVKDFGAPFGVVDDAEVKVTDVFYIRIVGDSATSDSTSVALIPRYQQRVLHRWAYFLRFRQDSDAYAGWLMHGYNGGIPHEEQFMEIIKSNGDRFPGDGRDYNHIRYLVTITIEHRGDDGVLDSTTDSTWGQQSNQAYVLVSDIERIAKGDRLIVRTLDPWSDSPYMIVSAEDDIGPVYRLMHRPETGHYVDTIRSPMNSDRIWNTINFFGFRLPDRPGGIWCVPYRVQ